MTEEILKSFEPLFERMSKADISLNKPAFFKQLSQALDTIREETLKEAIKEARKERLIFLKKDPNLVYSTWARDLKVRRQMRSEIVKALSKLKTSSKPKPKKDAYYPHDYF